MVLYCDRCGKCFPTHDEEALEKHIKKVHGGQQSKLF